MDGNHKVVPEMNEEFREEIEVLKSKVLTEKHKPTTVFYGSSSIRLWDTLSVDFPEFNCLNLAFGGSQIKDCYGYYDDLLAKVTPERIIFYAGDNDIGDGCNAEEVLSRFKKLYGRVNAQFPEVPFVFLSIKPSPSRLTYLSVIKEANKQIKEYLDHSPNASFIDVFSAMINTSSSIDSSLFQEDNLHLNEKGYDLWKKILREGLSLDAVEC